MTIGSIGNSADISGTIAGSGVLNSDCVVGGLDANGNTIVSCGWDGTPLTTGQMIPNAPTCMPGDSLSFQDGNWVCVSSGSAGASALPWWLVPAVIGIGALALIGAKR